MPGAWERSEGTGPVAEPGLREAERFCRRMARREAKNFYWGFVSLPADQRVAVYALYDFARQVDDDADLGVPPPGERPARRAGDAGLERHRERVRQCVRGAYDDPVTRVLARAVERHDIPESELQGLIDGVEMDLSRARYATWPELEGYCRLVASTVGRMCVRIFGAHDPATLERAGELGVALQLTNILRDVREDAQMGRIYVPAEDLERFGVSETAMLRGEPGQGWAGLVDFEARRARRYFARGLGVLELIPRRQAACVRTMAAIYQRILAMVEREPSLPLRQRASLSPAQKLVVVARAWTRRG